MPGSWRRYARLLAQVWFLVGDLRRKTGFYALLWRRSSPFFLTCAKNHPRTIDTCTNISLHLRQKPFHLHHVAGKVNGYHRTSCTTWLVGGQG